MKKASIIFLIIYAILIVAANVIIAAGWNFPQALVGISTVAGFTFSLLYGTHHMGWRKMLLLLAVGFVLPLGFESLGVASGLVYGPYHYTDRLGPKFLGLVPYLIPLAWLMMMYPSLVIAQKLLGSSGPGYRKVLKVSALGGVIMTCWDLVMDPVMVMGGHWVWDGPLNSRVYFGIPLQNFWGWWLTTFATFFVFQLLAGEIRTSSDPAVEHRLPVFSYALTGLASILSAFQGSLTGPALIGLAVMAPWVIAGLKKKADEPDKRLKTTWF